MALSKPWSSEPTVVAKRKHFTVREANRALPLVSRIISDLVQTHDRATRLHSQLDGRVPPSQRQGVEQELEQSVDRLGDLVAELKDVGCELKDYRIGLIDFVGKHQGREICLCWKLGEPSIGYWHEMTEGFNGRRPITHLDCL